MRGLLYGCKEDWHGKKSTLCVGVLGICECNDLKGAQRAVAGLISPITAGLSSISITI